MSHYRRGRAAEHRARKILETAGYEVVRAAGSKGPADLVAWDRRGFRLIQVKTGQRGCGPAEREALTLLPRPLNSTVEVWRFPLRCREPRIEVL